MYPFSQFSHYIQQVSPCLSHSAHTTHASLSSLPGRPVLRGYGEPINREGEILSWHSGELSIAAVVPK